MLNNIKIALAEMALKNQDFLQELDMSMDYWHTGWESQIIELRRSLIFLNQLQPLAACTFIVSLGSDSINASYSIYVRITLSS